jgi:hypothetical protein
MGSRVAKDCGCFTVVSKVAFSLWEKRPEDTRLSILDEVEITPAGLLSEQEIQFLLMENNSSTKSYETV